MNDENIAICERCQIKFDIEEASEEFLDECLKEWNNLKETLCAKCSIEAIEACEDGIYFEFCERCGKEFDHTEKYRFENEHPENDSILDFTEEILCFDCLEQAYDDWCDEQRKIERELGIENDEKPYKDCPKCGSIMYWDEVWQCSNCLFEINTDEDDADGNLIV